MKYKFSFKQFIVPNFWKRLAFMLPAVLFMGFFVSILLEINWGTDPASFMNFNIAHTIKFSLGTTEVIVYGVMLVIVFFTGANRIGFGTLANMILIGYTVDLCRWIWGKCGFHDYIMTCSLAPKIGIFVVALLLFVVVAAIYMNAQMGVAPYDALPSIISEALPKVPYFVIRIIYDFLAMGIGIFVSVFTQDGIQGSLIGASAMSILIGPAVSLVAKPLSKLLK